MEPLHTSPGMPVQSIDTQEQTETPAPEIHATLRHKLNKLLRKPDADTVLAKRIPLHAEAGTDEIIASVASLRRRARGRLEHDIDLRLALDAGMRCSPRERTGWAID